MDLTSDRVCQHTILRRVGLVPQIQLSPKSAIVLREPLKHGLRYDMANLHPGTANHARPWPGGIGLCDGTVAFV